MSVIFGPNLQAFQSIDFNKKSEKQNKNKSQRETIINYFKLGIKLQASKK